MEEMSHDGQWSLAGGEGLIERADPAYECCRMLFFILLGGGFLLIFAGRLTPYHDRNVLH